MGLEAHCKARVNGVSAEGKARLETDVLEFRATRLKVAVSLRDIIRVSARNGVLAITFEHGSAALELGSAAERWADKILHPPSRMQQIGVKPGWRASVIGAIDQDFLEALEETVDHLSIGRVVKESDAIFYAVTREAELARLSKLKAALKPDGALWIVRPKGRSDVSEKS